MVKIGKRVTLISAATVVAAGGTAAGLLLTSGGSSYKQAWCAGAFHYMYYADSPTATFQTYLTGLGYEERQGAPLSQLITDEQQASQDSATAASADNFSIISDNSAVIADLQTIKSDAGAINQACGEPSGWNADKLLVPSSN